MHRQIAVAGMEPCRLAELHHRLQAKEGIALHAPSALAAQHAGEHVGDRIDVGRDVKSPPHQIVARIHYQRDVFRRHDLAQSVDKLRAAGASAEDADHAALRASPSPPVAARNFSERRPGFAVTRETYSGYIGSRWRSAASLPSVRKRNCSR